MAATELSSEILMGIIEGLFLGHDPSLCLFLVGEPGTGSGDEERDIDRGLAGTAKSLSVDKAAGPDGVPKLAIKVAIAEAPEMFRSAMQKFLDEGVFPEVWKRQSLVLLPKAGKPPGDPSAYRPIDTAGKVIKKITLNGM